MSTQENTISDRSRSLREWIESDRYSEGSPLELSNDDFARMMIYLLSIEKTQRYLTNALDLLDKSPAVAELLAKAKQSEQLSARISESLIRTVRTQGTPDAS